MAKEQEYREWFLIAEKDLKAAEYLQNMFPPPLEIICYHCQQSAEKFLKGYLISKNQLIKRTHDLTILYKDCFNIEETFQNIEEPCINLTDYAVNTRYPYPLEITETDMKIAIKDCLEIRNFICKYFELI